jgi:benzoyl-CoA reductase subunit C
MNVQETITKCRAMVSDPNFESVTEWKSKNNGKVVGYFPVYSPQELIHAGGMLPVGIFGGGNKIEIDYADSRIQSFVCSISRSTLELGLTGRLKNFDGMLFSSICDVARNLSGVFKRNFPNKFVDYLHLPENIDSKYVHNYLCDELNRLKTGLEELSGKKISDENITNSIKVLNENRELIKEIYKIKRATPHLLSTSEAYSIVRAGTVMAREEHSNLIKRLIAELPNCSGKIQDKVRVIVEGSFCEQPPIELIETLEEAGCYIIEDDFILGTRWLEKNIELNSDPIKSIADTFIKHSIDSAVRFNGTKNRGEIIVEKVKRLNADGVIFCSAKFCDPAQFDYVLLKNALDKAGIPFLAFEFEEKMSVFENIKTQVETFVESVLFFS